MASVVKPPKVEETEFESLKADEIDTVLAALKDYWLETISVLAISTGARRGEILALTWTHVDLDAGTIKIERSLEQTKTGLRFKAPKAAKGKRTVSLPPIAVDALRSHRRRQLELRLAPWSWQARTGCPGVLRPQRRPHPVEQSESGLAEVRAYPQAAANIVPRSTA